MLWEFGFSVYNVGFRVYRGCGFSGLVFEGSRYGGGGGVSEFQFRGLAICVSCPRSV